MHLIQDTAKAAAWNDELATQIAVGAMAVVADEEGPLRVDNILAKTLAFQAQNHLQIVEVVGVPMNPCSPRVDTGANCFEKLAFEVPSELCGN